MGGEERRERWRGGSGEEANVGGLVVCVRTANERLETVRRDRDGLTKAVDEAAVELQISLAECGRLKVLCRPPSPSPARCPLSSSPPLSSPPTFPQERQGEGGGGRGGGAGM